MRLALQGDTCPIGNILVYWCFLLFNICLPTSTHFLNLNFFILFVFCCWCKLFSLTK